MKYATALCLALAGGWATEHEAFRPPMNSDLLFRRSRRHSHPTTPSSSLQRDVSSSLSRNTLCHLPVTQTSTSTTTRLYLAANKKQPPHPPNQPPPDSILKDDKDDDDDNNDETTSTSTSSSTSILSYFTKQAINPNRTPFFTADPVERQAQQAQRQELVQRSLLQAKLRNDALSYAIRVAQELEQQANTSNTSPPPPTTSIEAPPIPPIRPITKIPAKPLVTPSQQEEFQRGLARFYQDIVVGDE